MLCLLWFSSGGKDASTYSFIVCLLVLGLWHGGLTCCGVTLTAGSTGQSIFGSQLRRRIMCWASVACNWVEGRITGVCIAVIPGCCMVCLSTCRGAWAPCKVIGPIWLARVQRRRDCVHYPAALCCRGHGGHQ